MYGGLGNDFMHGGAGDDAISGAEALRRTTTTRDPLADARRRSARRTRPDNELLHGLRPVRPASEFRYYNENDPLREDHGRPASDRLPAQLRSRGTHGRRAESTTATTCSSATSATTGSSAARTRPPLRRLRRRPAPGRRRPRLDRRRRCNNNPDEHDDRASPTSRFGGAGRDVLIANTARRPADRLGRRVQQLPRAVRPVRRRRRSAALVPPP